MGEELTAGVPGNQVLAALEVNMELEKGVLAEGSLSLHSWILPQENTSEKGQREEDTKHASPNTEQLVTTAAQVT